MVMKFNTTAVTYSAKDLKKGIILPGFLSRGLAEDIEIMIGDGSIFRQTDKFGYKLPLVKD